MTTPSISQLETPPANASRRFKYFDLILGAFVTVLVCSNVIGAGKVCRIGNFTFGAAVLFFPISYFFGDVLTEVYGYAHARRAVWAGLAALAFASFMSAVVVGWPPAPGWPHQSAYEVAFGATPRIILASVLGFWAGEFANSYTLAKMKMATKGRWLWTRTIGSTVVGEAVDSAIFYPVAFLGIWSHELLIQVMVSNYLLKTAWETLFTPITYRIVGFLKRAENEDHYDWDTDFSPFHIKA